MKLRKLRLIMTVLLIGAIPLFARPSYAGPKSWFHSKKGAPQSSKHRSGHSAPKHHTTKHAKPHHARNSHP